jgi:glycosyltransferase involved in cell wall biosynthesis
MASNHKITVLMCVYNSIDYLCEAIESVLYQPYRDLELIIIDDSSTDDSWLIACEYAASDERVVLVSSETNQGASAALNKGLQIASGDYITRHDSDDVMNPDRLVEQVSCLDRFPQIGAVGTNVVYIDSQGEEYAFSSFPLSNDVIQEALPDYMCFCGPTICVRKDAFIKAGYYFTEGYSTAEDYELCLRLSEVTQMANLENPLYRYRQHPNSVSASKRHQQLYYKVRSLEQAAFRRFGTHPPEKFIDYIARDYLRSAVLGCLSDQIQSSKRCLEIALRYRPDLLRSGSLQPPLTDIIKRYLPEEQPLEDSLDQVERLFRDLLPQESHLARLKSRLIAEIYIVEAFARAQKSPAKTFEPELLWKGVRHDPRWLSNRGVASILIKQSLLRRKPGLLP